MSSAPDTTDVSHSRARSLAHEYGYEALKAVLDGDFGEAARKFRHAAQFAEALQAGLPGGDD